jgi:hypothetical protein
VDGRVRVGTPGTTAGPDDSGQVKNSEVEAVQLGLVLEAGTEISPQRPSSPPAPGIWHRVGLARMGERQLEAYAADRVGTGARAVCGRAGDAHR